ncbi:hypothetical protein C6503_19240 [Candidatus Poribacteria bacterium]|nr:MAG: hypothetical protein C6503_19240 [Candidatus Poribacteria bacterium]
MTTIKGLALQRTEGNVFVNVTHPKAHLRPDPYFQTWTRIAKEVVADVPTHIQPLTATIGGFNESWRENRQRLLDYLRDDLTLSDGVILHELGRAIETEYAARVEMTTTEWRSLTVDLRTPNYFHVAWMHTLRTRLSYKYQDHRTPRTDLKELLMQVNAIMGEGRAA